MPTTWEAGDARTALSIIDEILSAPEERGLDLALLDFSPWSNIHVYIPAPDINSAITPPFMEAFLELQRQLYQLSALLSTGVADAGQLSEHEKQELQINVIVSGGSSDYIAPLKEPLQRLLKQMIGRMTGRQCAIVIVALAALLAGSNSFGAWLEEKRLSRIDELRTREHVQALQELSFANESETELFQRLIELLEHQGDIGQRAIDALKATNEALLKAAAKTSESNINGQTLNRFSAELLRISPRKKPEVRIVKQRIRVVDINTSDPFDLQIILMDPDTKTEHRIRFKDSLFAGPDRERLFGAPADREPLWVELALRELDGEIKSLQLLRCIDPPWDLLDAEASQ